MKIKVVSIVLIVAALALGAFALATQYGTQSDPLVSLSYINDVLKKELMSGVDKASAETKSAVEAYEGRVDKKVDEVVDRMSAAVSDADLDAIAAKVPTDNKQSAPFATVTVSSGKSVTLKEGAEILSRGELKLTGSVIDISAGGEITGKIPANHLCTAVSTATVSAAKNTTVYIRGDYMMY